MVPPRVCLASAGKMVKFFFLPTLLLVPCAALSMARSSPSGIIRSSRIIMAADPDPAERVAAAAPYLLPCLDGFLYGIYVYTAIPPLGSAALAVLPVVNSFQSLPFAGLILFIGLSAFTRNQGLSRFVRFNIQQALLLDILLIIPSFFGGSLSKMFPQELNVLGTNTVFYAWVLVVLYSWSRIAFGKTPDQVPVLSEAASMQVGPM